MVSESVTVVRNLGLQLTTTRRPSVTLWPLKTLTLPSGPVLTRKSDTFIPLDSVRDVVINEGIQGWRVVYYLAVLYRHADDETSSAVHVRIAFPVRLLSNAGSRSGRLTVLMALKGAYAATGRGQDCMERPAGRLV